MTILPSGTMFGSEHRGLFLRFGQKFLPSWSRVAGRVCQSKASDPTDNEGVLCFFPKHALGPLLINVGATIAVALWALVFTWCLCLQAQHTRRCSSTSMPVRRPRLLHPCCL